MNDSFHMNTQACAVEETAIKTYWEKKRISFTLSQTQAACCEITLSASHASMP